MHRANDQELARVSKHISVTPTQLRAIADRIEAVASKPGEQVTYELTTDTTLIYEPKMGRTSDEASHPGRHQ